MYICSGIQQETHSCVHAHSTIKKPAMIKIKFTNHFEAKNQSISMKRAIAMVFVALMMSISAHAQKIQVLDADGNAIPLVSVLTEDGVLIGTTDINGTLANVKGAAKVALTHLAYKPQLVSVASLTDGRVTMESVDYGLTEVVVKPKPYLYTEYYYRAFFYIGDSLRAYGGGIVPVAYEVKNNYKAKIRFVSSRGAFANKAPGWHGSSMENQVENSIKNTYKQPFEKWHKLKRAQEEYRFTMVSDGPNRWRVEIPTNEVVGQVIHSGNLTRTTIDASRVQMYADEVHGREKQLKKDQEVNYQYKYVSIFKLDDEEDTPDITRHVMTMNQWERDTDKGREIKIYYIYTTDHSYMDEDEYKARSKELNEGHTCDMTLTELQEYERDHNIPALSSEQLQAIKGLKKGQGK